MQHSDAICVAIFLNENKRSRVQKWRRRRRRRRTGGSTRAKGGRLVDKARRHARFRSNTANYRAGPPGQRRGAKKRNEMRADAVALTTRREGGRLACFRKPRKRTASKSHGHKGTERDAAPETTKRRLKARGALKSALSFARGDNGRVLSTDNRGHSRIPRVCTYIYIKEALHKRRRTLMRVSRMLRAMLRIGDLTDREVLMAKRAGFAREADCEPSAIQTFSRSHWGPTRASAAPKSAGPKESANYHGVIQKTTPFPGASSSPAQKFTSPSVPLRRPAPPAAAAPLPLRPSRARQDQKAPTAAAAAADDDEDELSVRSALQKRLRKSVWRHEANARNARLLFVARARHTHAYAFAAPRRERCILARGSLLQTAEIITRVTESKVKYYRPCERGPFTRVFVPYPPMNIVRRVLAERAFAGVSHCVSHDYHFREIRPPRWTTLYECVGRDRARVLLDTEVLREFRNNCDVRRPAVHYPACQLRRTLYFAAATLPRFTSREPCNYALYETFLYGNDPGCPLSRQHRAERRKFRCVDYAIYRDTNAAIGPPDGESEEMRAEGARAYLSGSNRMYRRDACTHRARTSINVPSPEAYPISDIRYPRVRDTGTTPGLFSNDPTPTIYADLCDKLSGFELIGRTDCTHESDSNGGIKMAESFIGSRTRTHRRTANNSVKEHRKTINIGCKISAASPRKCRRASSVVVKLALTLIARYSP
ncbi:hypothetical protein DBV15_01045 [Temnothorax longispinosus]|uniref:Uncharacterized protein n=1 Tax=Temnothorax longispinosus TaxID=300112 RepID=A0A4S2JA18_9HYME|nr:hypothetical protein DBV15_01045 [Temnothorax longispinosus]